MELNLVVRGSEFKFPQMGFFSALFLLVLELHVYRNTATLMRKAVWRWGALIYRSKFHALIVCVSPTKNATISANDIRGDGRSNIDIGAEMEWDG